MDRASAGDGASVGFSTDSVQLQTGCAYTIG